MYKLNKQQKKWLEAVYNRAFRESNDSRFSLRFATGIYHVTKLNPKFESVDGSLVGIAGLPVDVEGVDVNNTEESIAYAVNRDLNRYIESNGDLTAIQAGDPEQAELIESHLDEALFGDQKTFTGLNSSENRFRAALAADDTDQLSGIVDELISNRVNSRNKVITNA